MGIEQHQQLTAFLYAILTGVFCGTLYDCFRVLRVFIGVSCYTQRKRRLDQLSLPLIGTVRSPRTSDNQRGGRLLVLAIGDVLFFFLAGCAFCVFLYHAASGCFRWFYLFGAGAGFSVYYITVGNLVMLSSEMLAFLLRVCLRYLWWTLCVPFRIARVIITRVFQLLLCRVWTPLYTVYKRKARIRYTRRVRAHLINEIRFTTADLLE